jgi:hypothetical protein
MFRIILAAEHSACPRQRTQLGYAVLHQISRTFEMIYCISWILSNVQLGVSCEKVPIREN